MTTPQIVLLLLQTAATLIICVGLYTDIVCAVVWLIRGGTKRGKYRSPAIYYWLLPFYWPSYLVLAFNNSLEGERGWMITDLVLAALWYWLWRRSDDDRWKKLRTKAKEKVAVRSGRLVVVPVRS